MPKFDVMMLNISLLVDLGAEPFQETRTGIVKKVSFLHWTQKLISEKNGLRGCSGGGDKLWCQNRCCLETVDGLVCIPLRYFLLRP